MGRLVAEGSVIVAGLVAYGVAVVAATLLVFLTYRVNLIVTRRQEEDLLLAGHKSMALAMGAVLLSQAILLRHAVFPIMAVVRDLFLQPRDFTRIAGVAGQCALFFFIIGLISIGSVHVAVFLFTRLTGRVPEQEEIRKDNAAVAIFFAFAVLAVTVVLNEGMEDLSRSLIPYGSTRVLRLP
jgi:uncharacterized membrane protein YjfL (UPF0719 family)